jgi:D-serine deaminase-like pyridoxal phosphate-dependent protein
MEKIETDFAKIKPGNFEVVAGGSPAFNIHSRNKNRVCSPGTSVFWDWGYGEKFTEQGFLEAAILVCRVISKPTKDLVTIDLGHKAVSAENPINKRIKFLNLEGYKLLSQSEEHGVLSVKNWNEIAVGDVFYGVPYHVCPTVNLYEEMGIAEKNEVKAYWQIIARKRKITI